MPDDEKIKNKLQRQLTLLAFMIHTEFHSPYDVMTHFRYPNRRAMERDFKDLRDAGVIRVKYKKMDDSVVTFDGDETVNDNYIVDVLLGSEIKETVNGSPHLEELNHMARLIAGLPQTDFEALYQYEQGMKSKQPVLADAAEAYHRIFPGTDESNRERDFKKMNRLGFCVEYSENYKGYIVDIRFCSEERHFCNSPRGIYWKKINI